MNVLASGAGLRVIRALAPREFRVTSSPENVSETTVAPDTHMSDGMTP